MNTIWLQIDATPGAFQGQAGLGIVIRQPTGMIVRWTRATAPATTNNSAEYQALIHGVRLVIKEFPHCAVVCLTDSQLIVDHLTGRCAVKTPHLHPLHEEACRLISRLVAFRVVHIRRELNRLADALAWEALGGTQSLVRAVHTYKEDSDDHA